MSPDHRAGHRPAATSRHRIACVAAFSLLLAGCASPPPVLVAAPAPLPKPLPAPAPAAAQPTQPAASPESDVIVYADKARALAPPDLAQEIVRLGEPRDAPVPMLQLAWALGLTRAPGNLVRAQALVQRALALDTAEARALQPLARMLAAQLTTQAALLADVRRLEEQVERQGQQVQAGQRRIDQLNDRLEAVRAIERSLPSASTPSPNGQRP